MTLQQILFIIFGAITLGAALMVVTRRNVFHAALFMILSFFGVAGLYVLLEAPFLATLAASPS
jgi:NADH-quinone oxidoreductase subunit J